MNEWMNKLYEGSGVDTGSQTEREREREGGGGGGAFDYPDRNAEWTTASTLVTAQWCTFRRLQHGK